MSKNKILIVEEERITAEDLKNTLENLGYEVSGIASSADTFRKCLKLEMPDLVLMDILLKGEKDGIELAAEIKDEYHLPVIYLTAYSDSDVRERARINEPFGYIMKPFQERELHSNIEIALDKNRMEKRINHLTAILKAIRDVNQLIVSVNNTDKLFTKTCETLISTGAYSSAWIVIIDKKGEFQDAASAGEIHGFDDFIHKFRNGQIPDCVEHLNKSIEAIYSMKENQKCSACSALNPYADIGSIISKVHFHDRLYGYLYVKLPQTIVNDPEELALFRGISDDLGLALNNLELKKKKEEAEEALAESEIHFRHAFDFAATSMCLIGLDGRFTKINNAFNKFLGYSEADIHKLHFNDITHPDDLDNEVEVIRKLMNREISSATFEKRYLTKSGLVKFAEVSVSLVRNDKGQPRFLIAQLNDLTERKLAELKLKEEQEQYRTFMDSTSDMAYLKDDQFRYLMVNEEQQKFFNRTVAEITGKTDNDLMPEPIAATCHSSDLEVLTTNKLLITNELIGDRLYELRKFPVKLDGGKTGVGAFIRDITERMRAELELQKLSQVVLQSPEAIFVTDTNGIIEYANPSACRISGYTQEELIGANPRMLKSGETSAEVYELLWNTIKAGQQWKGEFHNRKKNGELYWERATISPILNQKGKITQFLGIKEDITGQKHNESIRKVLYNISKQVFESNDLQQLLEIVKKELSTLINTRNFYVAFYNEETGMLSATDASDENDNITTWPAEKSLTGYVIKHNKSFLFKRGDIQKLHETGEVEQIGSRSRVWLGVPLTVDGKPYGAFVVQDYHTQDAYGETELNMLEFIASQVSLSIQRQKSILELKDAFAKAEAGDKLKTAFINNISHEIRTPLNGILGFSEMILTSDSTREDNELFFSIIKKSSKRLLNTITSYMDISMLVSGTMEITRRSSNLDKLLKEIFADFVEIATSKGIELKIRKPDLEEPVFLNTDIEKLRKIISHLLDNALKFTQKGNITFGFEIKDGGFEFAVSDTGTGIKTDTMNIIFNAFMQADVSPTRGYEGSGLGLTIANGLVKLLGGDLWIDTERGLGSTIYFTIPFSLNPILTPLKPVEMIKTEPLLKPLILVAEDDDSNYKYIEIVLLYADYLVIRAENGIEAVECCRTNPDIRLVLMDIKMPLMDGFKATRQIRTFLPDLPIIALTAHVTTEDENMAITSGCNEYVTKPVTKGKLLEIIKEALVLDR